VEFQAGFANRKHVRVAPGPSILQLSPSCNKLIGLFQGFTDESDVVLDPPYAIVEIPEFAAYTVVNKELESSVELCSHGSIVAGCLRELEISIPSLSRANAGSEKAVFNGES
jgi:hypothetical protein